MIMTTNIIQTMTGQGHTCVQRVVNDFPRKDIWMLMNEYTPPARSRPLYVRCVTDSSQQKDIWPTTWRRTGKVSRKRDHSSVPFAANASRRWTISPFTAELTVEINRTNVACARRRLRSGETCTGTWECTRETDPSSAPCATKRSPSRTICRGTTTPCTTTGDHTTVRTAESCSNATASWNATSAYTPDPSPTRADTARSVFPSSRRWSDISSSVTTKAPGWSANTVRGSSQTPVTCGHTYVGTRAWSRSPAASVRCVSTRRVDWSCICRCIWNTSSTAAACAVNATDTKTRLYSTLRDVPRKWDLPMLNLRAVLKVIQERSRVSPAIRGRVPLPRFFKFIFDLKWRNALLVVFYAT